MFYSAPEKPTKRIQPRPSQAIKISLEEIKYEVKFDTWLKSKAFNEMLKANNDDANKVNMAYNNDKAEDWLVRQIETAIDHVYAELRWCVDEYNEEVLTDEITKNPKEWVIKFNFPFSWSGSMRALRSSIHQYVVECVLFKWFSFVNEESSTLHKVEAEEMLAKAYDEARSDKVEPQPWNL